jgi:phage-related minor tail protein
MSDNTETLGIRLSAEGVVEATNGASLMGKAVEDVGKKADTASPKLDKHAESTAKAGNSAKQTAAAFRLLPAQITDVVTSLASGQPAWLIAIQQGGQIKDSFGGIGPAFRAITGAISPMTFALGGAAAVVGVLLVAHEQGAREAQGYSRALIMTGNAAGTTKDQMADMARGVSASVGTQSKAAEALTLLAATGEVARANLAGFRDTALNMERTLGQPLADTAQKFQDLGRAPLEATMRLNKGVNYLTASTYEQIRALQAQGRIAEAGEVAQKAYADAMAGRTGRVQENLGWIEQAAKGAGDSLKRMWDKALDVGRADTIDQKIAKLRAEIAKADKPFDPLLGNNNWEKGRRKDNQAALDAALEVQRLANRSAEREGAETAARKEELRKLERANIDASIAIDLARADAAGTLREAAVARDVAIGQAQASAREAVLRAANANVDNLRQRDFISAGDYYERRAVLDKAALANQIKLTDEQISAEGRLAQSRIAVIDAQIAAEQRHKPEVGAETDQQAARLITLRAQRGEVEATQETRIIGLRGQRAEQVAQMSAAETAAARAFAAENDAAMAQFSAQVTQQRRTLADFVEAQGDSGKRLAVSLIADPYRRASESAQLDIAELGKAYDAQMSGLKARLALLDTFQEAEAEAVRQQIKATEEQKAADILLINRRLVEDQKPEWKKMLEGWSDTTRLMREAYNDFQTGWLRSGEDAWVQFTKTGKVNVKGLTDFALGEFGKLTFRQYVAPIFSGLGDGVAGLFGITSQVGDAAKVSSITAETTARVAQTSALAVGTSAIGVMASAASSAAAALAAVGAGGATGSVFGFLAAATTGGAAGGEAIGGFNGSAGDAFLGNVGHTGMIAGMGEGRMASYPASTWAGAGRMHTGGLAGDEVPAILQRGEGVFTKRQMQALAPVNTVASAGGGRTVNQYVTLNIDSRTDQGQIISLVQTGMRQAKAELLEEMDRGQV